MFWILSPAGVYFFYVFDKQQRIEQLAANSQITTLSTGNMQYRIQGNGTHTVLFVHGTPGGHDTPFELENVRLLKPSRAGYLGSDLHTGITTTQQAHAFSELLHTLEIDSVVLLAVSGGGPSALAFARQFPEKTRALILIESVSQTAPNPRAKVMPLFESDFTSWLFITVMHFLNTETVLKPIMPDEQNRQRIIQDKHKVAQLNQALWVFWPVSQRKTGMQNDWQHFQTLVADYNDIQVPTLIIHGDQDNNVAVEQSILLAQQIPHAQLKILAGADHLMTISHSEQIDAMISHFLNQLDNNKNTLDTFEHNPSKH